MKTIEEAAKEYADKEAMDFPTGTMSNDEVSDWLNSAFKAGVKFAQRWIPVEEELPEVGAMVLTKMEKRHGNTWVQNYYSTATRLENQGEWQTVNWVDHSISFGYITHWRHIDIE